MDDIVVLRALPGLGDLLCSVPALRAVRTGSGPRRIVLVGTSAAGWFADRYGLVDQVVPLSWWPGLVPGRPSPEAAASVVTTIRARTPSLVLQLHGCGPQSNLLASALAGGGYFVGAAADGSHKPPRMHAVQWDETTPEPLQLLDVVTAAGFERPASEGAHSLGPFPLTDADRREVLALQPPAPFACIHPGSTLSDRRWTTHGFAAVADHLDAAGVRAVLTGTRHERALAAEIVRRARSRPLDATGSTTLGGLAALLAAAELVVTNDTGASHLAAAVGTRSVIVFVVTDPRRWAPLDRVRHRPVEVGGLSTAAATRHVLDEVDQLIGAPTFG